jgi:transposase InsO family protein
LPINTPSRNSRFWCSARISDLFREGRRIAHPLVGRRRKVFTSAFRETLAAARIETVRLPPHSPNLNAVAERFVRTIQESCLERVILIGEASLRRAIRELEAHYHRERNHQGLHDELIDRMNRPHGGEQIGRRPRLGGLLNYYERAA